MTCKTLFVGYRRRSHLVLAIALIGLVLSLFAFQASPTSAAAGATSDHDRTIIATAVSYLMKHRHLSGHELDDEISRRCLDTYLKDLDPRKLYFYQSDIDEFSKYANSIDDQITQGDLDISKTVFERFLQRVDERQVMIDQLLDGPIDLTNDDELITDPDLLVYPKDEAEARERWRKRIEYDLLVKTASEKEPDKALEKLHRRYHSIAHRWHQTDDDELLEIYLSALTTAFDPHSSYMSADTLNNFEISMRLELEGIGASLSQEDGYTIVKKIIPGGAADKEGSLKVEDQIVSVGQGEEGDMTDVVDMKLTDVVKLIRGKRGTTVRLGVVPGEGGEEQIYKIVRERIELKDSEARSEIIEFGQGPDGRPFRVGVIDLPSFYMDMEANRNGDPNYKSSVRDVSALLADLNAKGVDAVVMDLRKNGGGSLIEAVHLTGLFIDSGPVVQVKGPTGVVQPHEDDEPGMAWSGPLVVLVSKFSASASEIFAGAIQDYHRGIIVGDESTHGKGTVQQVFDLGSQLFRAGPNSPKYGALKLTIQQFYRPSGDSTQNRGVLSDIVLPSLSAHWPFGESELDYAMAFDRVRPLAHMTYDLVTPELLNGLKANSQARLEQSEEFQKVQANVKRYLERKERKTRTLNEAKFKAEIAEFDVDKEQREQAEELSMSSDKVVDRDFYFDEALAITRDYVDMLNRNRIAQVAPVQSRAVAQP